MGKVVAVQPFCALEQTVEFYEIVVTCFYVQAFAYLCSECCCACVLVSECVMSVRTCMYVSNYHMLIVSVMGACSQQAGKESQEWKRSLGRDATEHHDILRRVIKAFACCVSFFFPSRKGRGFHSVEFVAIDPRQWHSAENLFTQLQTRKEKHKRVCRGTRSATTSIWRVAARCSATTNAKHIPAKSQQLLTDSSEKGHGTQLRKMTLPCVCIYVYVGRKPWHAERNWVHQTVLHSFCCCCCCPSAALFGRLSSA